MLSLQRTLLQRDDVLAWFSNGEVAGPSLSAAHAVAIGQAAVKEMVPDDPD